MYNKKDYYFRNIRKEILELIPNSHRNGVILEIGAGGGDTLIFAKENGYAKEVYGIDIVKLENSFQFSKKIDKFIIGDIERIKLDFPNEFFDVIICADILEHLKDPWKIIQKLKNYLKKNGIIITCLPNFRQIFIIYKILIKGSFEYSEAGILDKTHLRFFCKKDMKKLFENADLKIIKIISNSNLIGKTTKFINKITFNFFDEFLAAQYYIIAKK